MKLYPKPRNVIAITTDSYTGNFDRELMTYVFGFDSFDNTAYSEEYADIFVKETGISVEDSKAMYSQYLLEIYGWNDDMEEFRFYELSNYVEGKGTMGIEIFLNGKLPKDIEDRIKLRISNFFDFGFKEIELRRRFELFGNNNYSTSIPKLLHLNIGGGDSSYTPIIRLDSLPKACYYCLMAVGGGVGESSWCKVTGKSITDAVINDCRRDDCPIEVMD
jgi:hypothetical protein